ncbi:hypothetical protein TSAR_001292 [Trichomalopsis sarcophagae]|uniref:Uncharacterized protein n=1 Tax=Trichomalopsis sarcophagae TaxID=543379 RepID=A0A232FC04_9HYME|nr:hypothetical protein TSAR_001292 [Trichomalopsis sarcophagae]
MASGGNESPDATLNNKYFKCRPTNKEHPNFALTSKLPYGTLNQQACEFIAQLKYENREEVKREILNDIELSKKKDDENNSTIDD